MAFCDFIVHLICFCVIVHVVACISNSVFITTVITLWLANALLDTGGLPFGAVVTNSAVSIHVKVFPAAGGRALGNTACNIVAIFLVFFLPVRIPTRIQSDHGQT